MADCGELMMSIGDAAVDVVEAVEIVDCDEDGSDDEDPDSDDVGVTDLWSRGDVEDVSAVASLPS